MECFAEPGTAVVLFGWFEMVSRYVVEAFVLSGYVFFSTMVSSSVIDVDFTKALVIAFLNAGLAFFSYLAKVFGVKVYRKYVSENNV